jgi:hypothetical protein
MDFLKKNLVFSLFVGLCVLIFLAGGYLAFSASSSVGEAEQRAASAKGQLDALRAADPAPNEENVAAATANVAKLRAALADLRAELQSSGRLEVSSDGIGVMAAIQQFISDYSQKAAAHTNDNGDPDPIALPDGFAFGFERYLDQSSSLEDPERSAALDKQRQILSYVLDQLFASDPAGIISVERELLELEASDPDRNRDSGFAVSDAVSARVPGAIDTMGFSVTFEGFSDSLRRFLNRLAEFELPVVVRSIEVRRPSGVEATASVSPETAAGGNNLDSIFGGFGGGETAPQSEPEPRAAQKPVVAENQSTFTVVLEHIEVVLPSDAAASDSSAANL